MTDWSGGYVTDVPYTIGYYRQQSPQHMALACLLGGVAASVPRPDEPVSYLELGCGRGFGALLLAAANPAWRVTAVDFSPLHIVQARRMAAAMGLANVSFVEADLATLAEHADAIPEADFASMHGVWTWVGPAVRRGIVRLLRDRLRAGGVLHCSYNSLPGWQGALGLQRLIRQSGDLGSGGSDKRVTAGARLVRELSDAGAPHLQGSFASSLTKRLDDLQTEYLVHEYMHTTWAPCFHADLCADLADAKLDWVGTGALFEAFPELTLTAAQRAIHDRQDDVMLRELVKDLCLARGLRHDVFVRGPERIGAAARDAAIGAITLALTVMPANFDYVADFPSGRATLNRDFYAPMVDHLARGPCRIDALIAASVRGGAGNAGEVLAMLVGTMQAAVLSAPELSPATERAVRANRALAHSLVRPDKLGDIAALVAPRMGAGLSCRSGELFVADGLAHGLDPADEAAWAARLGGSMADEQRGQLRTMIDRIVAADRRGWEALGVLAEPRDER